MLDINEKIYLEQILEQLDCNQREAKIYLESLQSGASSVQDLANKLGQNRITIHSATEQLIKKGLLYETREKKKRLIVAADPEFIITLVQKKQNDLNVLKLNLEQALPLMNSLHVKNQFVPKVSIYEGVDGFKQMLEMTLSAKGEFLAIIDSNRFSVLLTPDYVEDFFKRRAEKNIYSRLIFPEIKAPIIKEIVRSSDKYKIQVRTIKQDLDWYSGFISWNDNISLKSFTQARFTCTIIQNVDIANFFRKTQFEILWNFAKPA